MKAVLLAVTFIIFSVTSLATDLTLEERVAKLEKDVQALNMKTCRLVSVYTGYTGGWCPRDSFINEIRAQVNGNFMYLNTTCYSYELICQ